jgi:hypothetical protein
MYFGEPHSGGLDMVMNKVIPGASKAKVVKQRGPSIPGSFGILLSRPL